MASHQPPSTLIDSLQSLIFASTPRPGLHPIPGTVPLTFEAAICPPLLYYVALLFLAPSPPTVIESYTISSLRNVLALTAGYLFFRLPLIYYVPQSIGLTYQLGLVGLYGGCRVIDAFFISPYWFGHVPRRVKYQHVNRVETSKSEDQEEEKTWSDGGVKDPFLLKETAMKDVANGSDSLRRRNPSLKRYGTSSFLSDARISRTLKDRRRSSLSVLARTLSGPDPQPVYETATTEDGWPHSFVDRASWALELELSMRGVGFTWTTADVRHTRETWLPTVGNRVHSITVHVLPVVITSWFIIKTIYVNYLHDFTTSDANWSLTDDNPFDTHLPIPIQMLLTASLGAFLMSSFSLFHSLFAILLHPFSPSPLSFFPPLYTTRVQSITSVRTFWSYGWHRLFARLFLVYGVWPGEWVERKITGKSKDQPADLGKVIGGFAASAVVHGFSVRGVLGGEWKGAMGEARFFALNGLAVVVEEGIKKMVRKWRKSRGGEESVWYDPWIGRVWWVAVLLWSGRNFARGWVKAGLVREMALMWNRRDSWFYDS